MSVAPVVVHVLVGPAQHGVVRHGLDVARACGDRVVRREVAGPVEPAELAGAQVVHVPYTDRLFGRRAEESADAFEAMTAPWLAAGLALSVTLHDLPAGDSAWDQRRRAAYDRVLVGARGVVLNSRRELELAGRLRERARSLRCIPLPVEPVDRPPREPAPSGPPEVVVLGFMFPDRGYEHTIAELPDGIGLLALGRASEGHEDLPDVLASVALDAGHPMRTTGFVSDAALGPALRAAGVPVAPNRRVAASGSINTWIAHGRRPLVPDSPYSRELAGRWPGTVTLYDADLPGDLRARLDQALAAPERTWLAPGTAFGPRLAEVAAAYLTHFAGCAPERPVVLGAGRWTVPGNRFDLLRDLVPDASPSVSVVVPYYDAQARLDLVLAALAGQDHPSDRLQVVVADDGSPAAPDLGSAEGLDVVLVRQPRDGFRAAAARNLGARRADGEVLLFLDADMVPEPGYVTALSRLPGLAPDALTVGRRRHAQLAGWTPGQVRGWLSGAAGAPRELTEPAWLRDQYAATANLLHADHRSHRWVISAVLGLHRELFDELQGFDERFRAYGGEDWDLAHRAWVAGAVLAHVPGAVAWHDGPDWAGRTAHQSDGRAAKNDETLTLTRLLPDPEARGGGTWALPAVAVVLGFAGAAEVLATARAAFSQDADCGVWVDVPGAEEVVRALADPRVHAGPAPVEVTDRAQAVVRLAAPARLSGVPALMRAAAEHGPLTLPTGSLTPSRASRRSTRWAAATGTDAATLQALLFGGRDLAAPVGSEPVDLAHELKHVRQEALRP